MTTQDIRTMHPYELIRGLMRGDRAQLKLGYTARNAALAAKEIHPDEDEEDLLAYAMGFAAGMSEDPDHTLPGGED